MTRLSGVLDPQQRSELAHRLASLMIEAVAAAGLQPIVITSSDEVARWAHRHVATVLGDPGDGLSAAVRAGVSTIGSGQWIVVHADLPLVTPQAIVAVVDASRSTTVLVPSYDGGTTVIGGHGTFPFSYGVGSFQRHYASAPEATVMVSPELSIDIDTEQGLALVPDLLRHIG